MACVSDVRCIERVLDTEDGAAAVVWVVVWVGSSWTRMRSVGRGRSDGGGRPTVVAEASRRDGMTRARRGVRWRARARSKTLVRSFFWPIARLPADRWFAIDRRRFGEGERRPLDVHALERVLERRLEVVGIVMVGGGVREFYRGPHRARVVKRWVIESEDARVRLGEKRQQGAILFACSSPAG